MLALSTQNAILEIEQPRAILSQQQPAAIIEMSTTKPHMSHDTTEIRAEMGRKSVLRSTEEFAQLGKQGAMEGIGRRAEQGRQLMDGGPGNNVLVQQAIENGSRPMKSLGIKFIPDPFKLQLSIQPGTLDIYVQTQQPINEVTIQKPVTHYTSGKITGEMQPWPSIQIDVKW